MVYIKGGGKVDLALFVSKVTAEMKLRRLTYKSLAEMTGYSVNTIKIFMALGVTSRPRSKKVAEKLSKALGIEL
jgi:transcriptional regulator with XRE-family HTH domain